MAGRGTPAVTALERAAVAHRLHEYDPAGAGDGGFGREAAEQLGLDPARVFKTLIVVLDADPRRFGVVVAPATGEVDLRAAAGALGAKRAVMADRTRAERTTGYVVGGISPFGQRKRLPTVLDETAERFDRIYVSGGRRGLEIEVAPADLVAVLDAAVAAVARS
jgi:Cys-tRNA(Pro)/Cys-tRNA(Cys) deacylase